MNLVHESTEDVDVRYRPLVEIAGEVTAHSELPDLLLSLRGHDRHDPGTVFTLFVAPSVYMVIANEARGAGSGAGGRARAGAGELLRKRRRPRLAREPPLAPEPL